MKMQNVDVTKVVEDARKFVVTSKNMSPETKIMFEMLLLVIDLFVKKFFPKNSKNSSIPPSADPNRKKDLKNPDKKKKAGGQNGHAGTTLTAVSNPDEVVQIKVDQTLLPKAKYKDAGYEARQVVEIKIKKLIIEYRAQILADDQGNTYTAPFPGDITQKIQYGQSIKAISTYMSMYQMVPYARVEDYFNDQMRIAISSGSIFNFNKEAYEKLAIFETIAKSHLINGNKIHADETGINVGGKRIWLHNASNDLWVHYYPHQNRGLKAMDEIGILANFKGVLCHDHWKPYYSYKDCRHSLCNAHHLRELSRVVEENNHKWAEEMQKLLLEINGKVNESEHGMLSKDEAWGYRLRYRDILKRGEIESPDPEPPLTKTGKKRTKYKKPRDRNLLERLQKFENDCLRFMEDQNTPFTNNVGENDLRMTKVQQKISGCFRSIEGAKIFCRVRSYLLTAQKHGMSPTQALTILFAGKLPDFCTNR